MSATAAAKPWEVLNKEFLVSALDALYKKLESYNNEKIKADKNTFPQLELKNSDSAFANICRAFNLSSFESELLLLCAGIELENRFAVLCSKLQDDPAKLYCTLSLTLSVLSNPHWSVLNPDRPLRRWKLIEIENSYSLVSSPLRIDEKILQEILGISSMDRRLQGIVANQFPNTELPFRGNEITEKIISELKRNLGNAIHLVGNNFTAYKQIVNSVCSSLNLNLLSIKSYDIPGSSPDRIMLARLLEREAYLNRNLLLIEDEFTEDSSRLRNLKSFIEETQAGIIISGANIIKDCSRNIIPFHINKMSTDEKIDLWKKYLGEEAEKFNGQIEKAAIHFSFSAEDMYNTAELMLRENESSASEELKIKFWNQCRIKARRNMENLAQRIESKVSWDDIVLPEAQLTLLHSIAVHLQQRYKVYESWGFKDKGLSGLGISALFTGISGTGKTLAAEILSNELQLDLYRIDLSSVVSKYIGETEKNLRRIFDSAEESGAILLFDEADALFGKRSEVKDSHDRYANIEVSYLLQRMELYNGLAILTTNLKNSLDTAFLRRIRFIVQFPFPDFNHRVKIWSRIFPSNTPVKNLDFIKLAQLNITGGNIRNIALNSAFLAANENESVGMKHILSSSRNEYAKLEKTLSEKEIEGWIQKIVLSRI